ncbi:MAG: hypothetical protein D6785_13725 [Planctomycetota bacterium]|nr:MAG: hypothetical protein D6785_13725 [Planctomycetota bacterium]
MPFAILFLLFGILSGLVRIGLFSFSSFPPLPLYHPYFMIYGFFLALISLERVVAFPQKWAFLAPCFAILGTFLHILQNFSIYPCSLVGWGLYILSTLILLGIYLSLLQTSFPKGSKKGCWKDRLFWGQIFMALGALFLLAGTGAFFFHNSILAASYWILFFVATIFGERLELSRIKGEFPSLFSLESFLLLLAAFLLLLWNILVLFLPFPKILPLLGLSMMLLSLWCLKYDQIWRTLTFKGLPRYSSLNLLAAYVWLLFFGFYSLFYHSFIYDIWLHSILLGFVFSMVFAHGPLIFPAISGISFPFTRLFYLPPLLLHVTLILRFLSRWFGKTDILRWTALAQGLSILLFFGIILLQVIKVKKGAAHVRR